MQWIPAGMASSTLFRRLSGPLVIILLFVFFTVIYEIARYLVGPETALVPLRNARELIRLERELGLFVEPGWQRAASGVPPVEDIAVWLYKYEHLAGSILFLTWLWIRRPLQFPFVWRWFWIAHAVAVAGFLFFPLAPPRLVPELGLEDPTAAALASSPGWNAFERIRNDFAAMPSLHVGYPLMFATVLTGVLPRWPLRGLVWIWPGAMIFVVVATANHYLLDVLGGAIAVAAAFFLALLFFRRLPRPWSRDLPVEFQPGES